MIKFAFLAAAIGFLISAVIKAVRANKTKDLKQIDQAFACAMLSALLSTVSRFL